MPLTSVQIGEWLTAYLWPLFRVGGMFLTIPVLSARFVPMRFRAAFAALVTAVIVPVIPPMPPADLLGADAALIIAQQILIGVAMGFVFQIMFSGIVFAAQGIALSMGLGFASMVDPQNGAQVPVVGQFYLILATLLFLVFNGHLHLIALLAESFRIMPVAVDGLLQANILGLLQWTGEAFAFAMLVALPAIGSLLLVNLSFGVVTRTAPQMNVFAVGFPAAMLLGFMVLIASLPNLPQIMKELVALGLDVVKRVVLGG